MVQASENIIDAIDKHDDEKLKYVLAAGADPNTVSSDWLKLPALHLAVGEIIDGGSLTAVRLLLEHGADVNRRDEVQGVTPLHIAIDHNEDEALVTLLEAGADPNMTDDEGNTPLRLFVDSGELKNVKLLLNHGAVRTIDASGGIIGLTPLGLAAERLDLPMIELLISAGADVEATDEGYKKARHRLPDRTPENAADWDRAAARLGGKAFSA